MVVTIVYIVILRGSSYRYDSIYWRLYAICGIGSWYGLPNESHTIKVLHPILGKTMVQWSVDAAHQANLHPVVVVGHQVDAVQSSLEAQHRDGRVSFVYNQKPRVQDMPCCVLYQLSKMLIVGCECWYSGDGTIIYL